MIVLHLPDGRIDHIRSGRRRRMFFKRRQLGGLIHTSCAGSNPCILHPAPYDPFSLLGYPMLLWPRSFGPLGGSRRISRSPHGFLPTSSLFRKNMPKEVHLIFLTHISGSADRHPHAAQPAVYMERIHVVSHFSRHNEPVIPFIAFFRDFSSPL